MLEAAFHGHVGVIQAPLVEAQLRCEQVEQLDRMGALVAADTAGGKQQQVPYRHGKLHLGAGAWYAVVNYTV
jgi:hypothetical protein